MSSLLRTGGLRDTHLRLQFALRYGLGALCGYPSLHLPYVIEPVKDRDGARLAGPGFVDPAVLDGPGEKVVGTRRVIADQAKHDPLG
jgi:hypothetical protein